MQKVHLFFSRTKKKVTMTTRSQIIMLVKTITYAQNHVILGKLTIMMMMTMNHRLVKYPLKYRLTFVFQSLWVMVII